LLHAHGDAAEGTLKQRYFHPPLISLMFEQEYQ
jgi:hypothetical protein